jgi:hypothetical protein
VIAGRIMKTTTATQNGSKEFCTIASQIALTITGRCGAVRKRKSLSPGPPRHKRCHLGMDIWDNQLSDRKVTRFRIFTGETGPSGIWWMNTFTRKIVNGSCQTECTDSHRNGKSVWSECFLLKDGLMLHRHHAYLERDVTGRTIR